MWYYSEFKAHERCHSFNSWHDADVGPLSRIGRVSWEMDEPTIHSMSELDCPSCCCCCYCQNRDINYPLSILSLVQWTLNVDVVAIHLWSHLPRRQIRSHWVGGNRIPPLQLHFPCSTLLGDRTQMFCSEFIVF